MREAANQGKHRSPATMAINLETQNPLQLSISAGTNSTELLLGHGILAQAADLLGSYHQVRFLLVSDKQVGSVYAAPLLDVLLQQGYKANLLIISGGEEQKSLDTLIALYSACCDLHIERKDVVIAVGGGTVGDIAGMLAGTYLRGLELIQVPTSLIAMISSSFGGKSGINFRGYKNLIGVFKQPSLVLADLDTLQTLPDIEFRSGLGELVTVGVLGSPLIFEELESNGFAHLTTSIMRAAIECKAAIVKDDPTDRLGIRARLNLGHTFAHALEKLSCFTLPHGLAVAVGLHIASRLAASLAMCPSSLPDRIRQVLVSLDLPVTLTGYCPEEMIEVMRCDKKCLEGQGRFVLPTAIGKVTLMRQQDVPYDLLNDLLTALVWEGRG